MESPFSVLLKVSKTKLKNNSKFMAFRDYNFQSKHERMKNSIDGNEILECLS